MSSSVLSNLLLLSIAQACLGLKLLTDSKKWDDATGEVGEEANVDELGGQISYLSVCGKTKLGLSQVAPSLAGIQADPGKGAKCVNNRYTLKLADLVPPDPKNKNFYVNATALQLTEPWTGVPTRTPTTCLDECITAKFLKKAFAWLATAKGLESDAVMFAKSAKTLAISRGIVLQPDLPTSKEEFYALYPTPKVGKYLGGGLFFATDCAHRRETIEKEDEKGEDAKIDNGVIKPAVLPKINKGWTTYFCSSVKCRSTIANSISDAAAGMSTKYGKPLYAKCIAKATPSQALSCHIGTCGNKYAFFGTQCATVSMDSKKGTEKEANFFGTTVPSFSVSPTPAKLGDGTTAPGQPYITFEETSPNYCAPMAGLGQVWNSAEALKLIKQGIFLNGE